MRRGAARLALALTVLMPLSGCGQSEAVIPATLPVKGKVSFKGKPLNAGSIVFEPTDSGKDAYGKIQPDGSFELTTYKENDGAVAGTHRVYVTGLAKNAIPLKFTHASSSKVEVEVGESTTDYPIDLK
jgi:hypothetical protein